MHFDGVVISGSVIVNESLLTGECVPVTKVRQAGLGFYSRYRTSLQSIIFCNDFLKI